MATVAVAGEPLGIAITPEGKHAYVGNYQTQNVSVIDTTTNTVVATIEGVPYVGGVAITPDGKQVYVTADEYPSGFVSVIDTATNTVVATTARVGFTAVGVAVTPDGKHAYVTSPFGFCTFSMFPSCDPGWVSMIDTATNTVVAKFSGGVRFPGSVAVSPDGKQIYVAN